MSFSPERMASKLASQRTRMPVASGVFPLMKSGMVDSGVKAVAISNTVFDTNNSPRSYVAATPPEPRGQRLIETQHERTHRACARRPRQCDRGVRSNHGEDMATTLNVRLSGCDDMARSALSTSLMCDALQGPPDEAGTP